MGIPGKEIIEFEGFGRSWYVHRVMGFFVIRENAYGRMEVGKRGLIGKVNRGLRVKGFMVQVVLHGQKGALRREET